jgi:hypothetical protein
MKESISLTWRRIPERYRIIGSVCRACNGHYFPKRSVCPKCRRKGKVEPYQFSGRGRIYSFTEIHAAPEGFEDKVPYLMAIVELAEGAHCTAEIVDVGAKDVAIGDEVEAVFRKIQSDDPEGLIHYGFKFRKVK